MKLLISAICLLAALPACITKTTLVCDPGFTEVDGACVALDGSVPDASPEDGSGDAGPDVPSACTTDCTGATPVCNEDTMECVECVVPGDCASRDPRTMCSDNVCVECTDNSQCMTPEEPVCATEGAMAGLCVPCDGGPGQCDGILDGETALGICDISGDTGVCVECTEATADTACGDFSCNPATNTCTETERGDVLDCGRCVSDTECDMEAGFRCVPMNFMGTARPDGYCLKLSSEGCERPYLTAVIDESLSGEPEAMYCGIDQATTTCDAVRALRESRECPGGDAGACADAGARCEMVGLANERCTYTCGSPDDCLGAGSGATCAGDYCGS